ncbi:MAG: Jag N-terminal domain-containing protein [Oscillospiraceae bacterium]|nr:Jag N-terminal domain-containing protein [Oscillospiraceae bacterium]
MTKYIETTGKTEELAIAAALEQLGLDRDDVSVEVLARAKTGFLGIGSSPAKVRVSYEAPDEAVSVPVPAPAPAPAEEPKEAPAPAVKQERKPEPVKKEKKPVPAKKAEPKPAAAEKAAPAEEKPAEAEKPAADRTADIEKFLIGLMEHLEVEAKPVITVNDEGTYEVVLEGEDLGALIGRRGETLDAIQQLTNYAVNHGQRSRARIHVDCENYRAKREESLQRLARKTAGKAVKYRRNMMLEPMNAYERHVIHAELQEYHPNISTYSTGTEPNRRIVVAYNK